MTRQYLQSAAPPSEYAIARLVDGKPGSLWEVVTLTGLRALLVAPGLVVADESMRGEKLVKTSLFVSGTITVGMLGLYAFFGPRRRR